MHFKIDDPNCTSEYDGDIEIPELGKWYSWEEVMDLKVFNVVLEGFGFVYIYYDMVNKKYYVGVCRQSVRTRARRHYNKSSNSTYVDRAIKDVGCNRFLVCVVRVCKVENLLYYENHFIDSLNTMHPNGYNALKSAYNTRESDFQKRLASEFPKERVLELIKAGYTYQEMRNTLPSKPSISAISRYVRLVAPNKTRSGKHPSQIPPAIVSKYSRKGYSDGKIAKKLGLKSPEAIRAIRIAHNIPCGGTKQMAKPVLKIDANSGVILARYVSATEASKIDTVQDKSYTCRRIREKLVRNGAYLIYEDEYLKQQRSVTQAVEGA